MEFNSSFKGLRHVNEENTRINPGWESKKGMEKMCNEEPHLT